MSIEKGIRLSMLRLDLLPIAWGGNKYFKLKYNLEEAKKQGKKCLLTFGGAYSNHIAATAAAGKENGFRTFGIIRGEKHEILNPTLQFAVDCGMQLAYISRAEYKEKNSKEFLSSYLQKYEYCSYSDFYILPEGGSNALAVKGCTEILKNANTDFDIVCCSSGTGATLAGLVLALKGHQRAIGISALKGGEFLEQEVTNFLSLAQASKTNFFNTKKNWAIETSYSFGGYAKINAELIQFKKHFEFEHRIVLDYVYTAKLMYAVMDLIEKDFFAKDTKLLVIHSGGAQGNAGFEG